MDSSPKLLTLNALYDFSSKTLRSKDPIDHQISQFKDFLSGYPTLSNLQMGDLINVFRRDYGLSVVFLNWQTIWLSYLTCGIVTFFCLLKLISLQIEALIPFAHDFAPIAATVSILWLTSIISERIYIYERWRRLWHVLVAYQLQAGQ